MARIAVVGSVAQDEVLELVRPLRVGQHLDAARSTRRLGGGGANTGLPLRHAGHEVWIVAPVGTDETGRWLRSRLAEAGLGLSALAGIEGESTRSTVLLEPSGERTIVNVHRCREASPPRRLLDLAVDAVYVRARETDLGDLLAEMAARTLVVAHVPPVEAGSRPAHVLVGSASDLPEAFLADPWTAGRAIAGERLRWVVVTRGAFGAEAASARERLATPAPPAAAVDTTGAGDVFAAGLVHALVCGRPMAEALEAAVAWGAAAVGVRGVPGPAVIRGLL